ncbi:GNAT family N-acetyltransferase [Candidatus Woesearchaeota archaeon]|nr:GNAT family N-acetyltransferase [Candidatus Woesearchaeota archaeon]
MHKLPVFKLNNFTIRPFKKGDEATLRKNINSRAIYRNTLRIPHPYTLKHANKWVTTAGKMRKTQLNLAIDIKGEVVGGIGFSKIRNRKAEIGYWLAKKHWNRGIMTAAVKKMSDYGLMKLRLKKITAVMSSCVSCNPELADACLADFFLPPYFLRGGEKNQGRMRRFCHLT